MRSNNETDKGMYVNGVYLTRNGINNGGLGCPKGTRLYDTKNVIRPFFVEPEDRAEDEIFTSIRQDAAPDILPYYAISNYGRIMNKITGNIMKPNYRPNGYEYYCLAADNCKNGQKKYSTHRMVMQTFYPIDNPENYVVNHINANKKENYVDREMPDGTIRSNLEWNTSSDNTLNAHLVVNCESHKLSMADVNTIRELRSQGYTYKYINEHNYPTVSVNTIQAVCLNKVYTDPNYTPIDEHEAKQLNPENKHIITERDVKIIRNLIACGFNAKTIHDKYYNDFSYSTILDIVNNVSHNDIK